MTDDLSKRDTLSKTWNTLSAPERRDDFERDLSEAKNFAEVKKVLEGAINRYVYGKNTGDHARYLEQILQRDAGIRTGKELLTAKKPRRPQRPEPYDGWSKA